MAKALTYVEIDVDHCSLTYSIAPCQATLTGSPPTGTIKCFNTIATCQDRENFDNEPVTIRFAVDTDYLPSTIRCIPNIKQISFTPATISLGKDLGQRASLTVTFKDHPHSDTGPGGDKYLSDRDYDPWTQGTFWGKFRARQPFLRGKPLRLIKGLLGDDLEAMETRHYAVESFNGPTPDGQYQIIAKDILKFADGDRAQAPRLNTGYLTSDISDVDTTIVLSPAGIGNEEEYGLAGYAVIAGKEIVGFTRTGGNDANTLLLVHADGNSPAVAIVDASVSARILTAVGNAQLDTGQSKFGGASITLDGTGDYVTAPDSNDWTFTGDFAIDAWFRFASVGAARPLWSHQTDASNIYKLVITSSNGLTFSVFSGGSSLLTISSVASLLAINTWYHIAVVRSGGQFNIYLDGFSVTQLSTGVGGITLPNYTGTFRIGMDASGTTGHHGWIDEFRVSNVARWTTNFTPPAVAYGTPTDTLTITRGQLGTEATEHKAQDRVQTVVRYESQSPAAILQDLFVNFADLSPAYISLDNWQAELDAHLDLLYTATISEPTAVNTLASELIEQAGLVVWWDDLTQQIKLQVLRLINAIDTFSDDTIIEGSLDVADQPDKRVSRVWTYFNQLNPTRRLEEDNFGSTAEMIDEVAEEDYGAIALKKIFSRWIPNGGRTIADTINEIQLARFRDPPRRFTFELMRFAGQEPLLGGGYGLTSWPFQDDTGALETIPIQITRVNPATDKYQIEAEEMSFETIPPDSPDAPHVVIFDTSQNNVNFRTVHDLLFSTPVSGDTVTGVINAAIIIGSTNAANPAFDVGSWPAGVTVNLTVNGRIEGKAGNGGTGASTGAPAGTAGTIGGPALYTRQAINLTDAAGQIWGGGGGGGGGAWSVTAGNFVPGSGGGGGGGQLPGVGGSDGGALGSFPGSNGTTELGGAGGVNGNNPYGVGGAGGNPGSAGSNGANGNTGGIGAAGAASGKAIDGISFVTTVGSAGSRLGGTIN